MKNKFIPFLLIFSIFFVACNQDEVKQLNMLENNFNLTPMEQLNSDLKNLNKEFLNNLGNQSYLKYSDNLSGDIHGIRADIDFSIPPEGCIVQWILDGVGWLGGWIFSGFKSKKAKATSATWSSLTVKFSIGWDHPYIINVDKDFPVNNGSVMLNSPADEVGLDHNYIIQEMYYLNPNFLRQDDGNFDGTLNRALINLYSVEEGENYVHEMNGLYDNIVSSFNRDMSLNEICEIVKNEMPEIAEEMEVMESYYNIAFRLPYFEAIEYSQIVTALIYNNYLNILPEETLFALTGAISVTINSMLLWNPEIPTLHNTNWFLVYIDKDNWTLCNLQELRRMDERGELMLWGVPFCNHGRLVKILFYQDELLFDPYDALITEAIDGIYHYVQEDPFQVYHTGFPYSELIIPNGSFPMYTYGYKNVTVIDFNSESYR